MNVYELQKEISTVLSMDLNAAQLRDSYEDLAERYVADRAELFALREALESYGDRRAAKEISDAAEKILDEYANRYVTPEMQAKLDELGFTFPLVLLSKDEAADMMKVGEPVLLLYNEDRLRKAESWEDVEAHVNAGGTVAADQFSIDEVARTVTS